jgi:sugar phosphate isomerase/epimerase
MKVGIISGWDEAGFQYVRNVGLHTAEFCVNVGTDAKAVLAKAAEIKALSEKYEVSVASIGRWGANRLNAVGFNTPEYENDLALIDLCAVIGTPVFVCGCNRVQELSWLDNVNLAVKYFKALVEYASPKNVTVAVYNCDWNNIIYDAKAWDIVLPQVPGLGLKYDCSHCINRDGDYLLELIHYGQHVKHFHIKGTVRNKGVNIADPPAGMDDIKWGAIMAILYDKRYDGVLSLEPHSPVWRTGPMGDFGVRFTIGMISKFVIPENYTMGDGAYMP